ncbi:MAG: hypothetical protein EXS32_15995 [Opitutus sp.]|nr:hypothetical protein [Opitutus sp.]
MAFLRGQLDSAAKFAGEAIESYRARSWPLRQAPVVSVNIALAEAFAGQADAALRDAKDGLARHIAANSKLLLGQINVILGRREEALAILRDTLAGVTEWTSPHELRLDPLWSRLKDDPRFEEILKSAKPL